MKFKHTFHVFVDNFKVTYKHLLYRVIIDLIAAIISALTIHLFIQQFVASESFNNLWEGVTSYLSNLLEGNVEELSVFSDKVKKAFEELKILFNSKTTQLILSGLVLLAVTLVSKWFTGLGNYATAAVINDKMALHADSPFLIALIRNLKTASLYNLIYVPLSIFYDLIVAVAMFFLLYLMVHLNLLPILLAIFVFVLAIILAVALKLTFTSDWLPALIRGKMNQGEAMKYTFARTNKNTLNIYSNFLVLTIIIMSVNVAAVLTTFGVGLLLTVPASYVILISFEFINYYNREGLKYFIDKDTIIKSAGERRLTREEFFRGDDED